MDTLTTIAKWKLFQFVHLFLRKMTSSSPKRMRSSASATAATSTSSHPESSTTITTITAAPPDSSTLSSLSGLLTIPLALLTKLTNYFTVRDFCNYHLVSRRLSTIIGRLESVEAHHSTTSISKETKFAMTHTLPKQLEISFVAAFDLFYDNLFGMTTLESLTLLSQSFKDINGVKTRDNLRERIRHSQWQLAGENEQQQQDEIKSLMKFPPSFPKLRSLILTECLGDTKLFDLFNLGSLTHLAIGTESDCCEGEFAYCPFHIYSDEGSFENAEHCGREWLQRNFSGLQSLSLMSDEHAVDCKYPSVTNFPSLTKLQLHIESDAPNRISILSELKDLPELKHLNLKMILHSTSNEVTRDHLDVLPQMKKLCTLDLHLQSQMINPGESTSTMRAIMAKIRVANQLASLSLESNVPILRIALQSLAAPNPTSTSAITATSENKSTQSSFTTNLRELKLNSSVVGLPSHQKEAFEAVEKFTSLTSLKMSNMSHPPDSLRALHKLRELDFSTSRPTSVFAPQLTKSHLQWMQMFSATLVKLTMRFTKDIDESLLKKYIEVIVTMPLVSKIVLPSSLLCHNGDCLRNFFVDQLRKLRRNRILIVLSRKIYFSSKQKLFYFHFFIETSTRVRHKLPSRQV